MTLGSSLPSGTYSWRVQGPDDPSGGNATPGFLANTGSVNLAGAAQTNLEMGLMRAGDCNNDNVVTVTVTDSNIIKASFGKSVGNSGYDSRADFTGDQVISVADFNLLKNNFGLAGGGPLLPGGR